METKEYQPLSLLYFLIYNILSLFLSLSHLPRPLFLQVPLDPAGAGPRQSPTRTSDLAAWAKGLWMRMIRGHWPSSLAR